MRRYPSYYWNFKPPAAQYLTVKTTCQEMLRLLTVRLNLLSHCKVLWGKTNSTNEAYFFLLSLKVTGETLMHLPPIYVCGIECVGNTQTNRPTKHDGRVKPLMSPLLQNIEQALH